MKRLSVRDIELEGRRILIRVDFNVPVEGMKIRDDTKVRAALPTIQWVLEHGGIPILASHLGRPKGYDPKLSLAPVAERLSQLLSRPVEFSPDCVGPEVEELVRDLKPGQVLLLENLRFHPEEEENDPQFAQALAGLADHYVNDAFATAHRAHASTVGIASYFSHPAAGLLMERELDYLSRLLEPKRPFVAVLGGAKLSDKLRVLKNLLGKADRVLPGGGLAFTLLKAKGYGIGRSIYEPELLSEVKEVVDDSRLLLPEDVKVELPHEIGVAEVFQIPEEAIGLDIGPKTQELFTKEIESAQTVVWAGPMGVFERPPFDEGSRKVAYAMARATELGATTVAGGGDTIAAIEGFGIGNRFSHLSTGGGACLQFLEGKGLPGVEVLKEVG